MRYLSFKEWKNLGYTVKKGEHSKKTDDDYKITYLFSEEQVVPIIPVISTENNSNYIF